MMGKISFSISSMTNDTVLMRFELKEIISPEDLLDINPPGIIVNGFSGKGIILSGRGPVWLYGFLIHFYHPTKYVAVHDPRLNGAVVVESHTLEVKVGDVIEMPDYIINKKASQ